MAACCLQVVVGLSAIMVELRLAVLYALVVFGGFQT
jgi:hypothetical protein